jgi:putative endonuclease
MNYTNRRYNFYVYILTNASKTVLYIGLTNNLRRRLSEHQNDALTTKSHFTGKYNVTNLVYWEHHKYINQAIAREKELKGWLRRKKEELIYQFNPQWRILNDDEFNS